MDCEACFERDFVRFCNRPATNLWFAYNYIDGADASFDKEDWDQLRYLVDSLSESVEAVDKAGGNDCDDFSLLVSAFGTYIATIEWYEFIKNDKEREVMSIRKIR